MISDEKWLVKKCKVKRILDLHFLTDKELWVCKCYGNEPAADCLSIFHWNAAGGLVFTGQLP